MQSRRKSRELALKILFQSEFQTPFDELDMQALIQKFPDLYSHKQNQIDFASEILKGLQKYHVEIDKMIEENSFNWKMERMSLVDLNIIRIAVFEILYKSDIPEKVSINEALELSKVFGDKRSPSFINGMLDQIVKKNSSKKSKNV